MLLSQVAVEVAAVEDTTTITITGIIIITTIRDRRHRRGLMEVVAPLDGQQQLTETIRQVPGNCTTVKL